MGDADFALAEGLESAGIEGSRVRSRRKDLKNGSRSAWTNSEEARNRERATARYLLRTIGET